MIFRELFCIRQSDLPLLTLFLESGQRHSVHVSLFPIMNLGQAVLVTESIEA